MKHRQKAEITPSDVSGIIKSATDFLLSERNRAKIGFCAQVPGTKVESCTTTAAVIYALSVSQKLSSDEKDKWKKELFKFYNNDGSFGIIDGNNSFLWSTSQACLALLSMGTAIDELLPSTKWLCAKQSASGGWSCSGSEGDNLHIIYALYPAIFLKRISKQASLKFVDDALKRVLGYVENYKNKDTLDYCETLIKNFLLHLLTGNKSFIKSNEIIKKICFEKYRGQDLSSTITETESPRLFYIKIFEPSYYLLLRPFISADHNISLYYIRYLCDYYIEGQGWDRDVFSKKNSYTWVTALSIATLAIWQKDCHKLKANDFIIPKLDTIIKNMREAGNMHTYLETCPMNGGFCNKRQEITDQKSNKRVFVDVPYDEQYLDYRNAVLNALKENGLTPVIADQKTETKMILCKVCSCIQTCSFGIADITSPQKGNIHLELGLMFGLNISCAVLMKVGKKVPSDLSGIEYLSYKNSVELKAKLDKWIKDNVTKHM